MVKAFEKRVQELLNNNPDMVKASLAELDGSRLKR
jgi:coenzyme Q-binding protein COQ10